jgi:hypothetical protein
MVGTYPHSAKSDIDYNITGKISEKIRRITLKHMALFNGTLDEIFDINLYGTAFDSEIAVFNGFPIIESQMIFAWMRVAKWSMYIKMTKQHEELTIKTLELKKSLGCQNYLIKLEKYLKNKDLKECSFEELVCSYSEAKYYEKEAYHSLGAVLHIVNGLEKMPRAYFIQSAYDNFGFVLEILHKKKCTVDFYTRIDKIAKYIYRICDAIGGHSKLKNYAKKHNKNRRNYELIVVSRERFLKCLLNDGKSHDIGQVIYDKLIKQI